VFFVEVAVDRPTGEVKVERVCCALDIGIVINEKNCTAGVRGAIMWGIGFCLTENLEANGHQILNANLATYGVPRFSDTPDIDVRYLRAYSYDGPRGVGEMPTVAIAPAVADAIHDAVGVRLHSTPFTTEKILRGLRRQ